MARTFEVEKQIRFALAKSLTLASKEGQKAAIKDVEGTFTVRNSWLQPSNAMGLRVLPATKTDLSTVVAMRADWLNLHETGEDKRPRDGGHVAVPQANVRRTKRDIIQRSQRPRALKGKRDVVLPLKSGGQGLFQRKGRRKNSRLVFLYAFARRARIRRQPTVIEPIVKNFVKSFPKLLTKNLKEAFRTSR